MHTVKSIWEFNMGLSIPCSFCAVRVHSVISLRKIPLRYVHVHAMRIDEIIRVYLEVNWRLEDSYVT
jgi:hypothetical protein